MHIKVFGLITLLMGLTIIFFAEGGAMEQALCPPTQPSTFCVLFRSAADASTSSVAFSPDGQWLASGCTDGIVRLWEITTGTVQMIHTLRHTAFVSSVAFSSDSTLLAAGAYDGTVKVWNMVTRQTVTTLSGHTDAVKSVAFSPDGRLLAVGAGGRMVKLWNIRESRQVRSFRYQSLSHTPSWFVYSVVFSPDGKLLATGGEGNMVRLWDIDTGQQLDVLVAHRGMVRAVVFSPNGQLLASISLDGTSILWDVTTRLGVRMRTLKNPLMPPHSSSVRLPVLSAAFSSDGELLATGSWDDKVRLWDVATGSLVHIIRHTDAVSSVAFSSDGQLLASVSDLDRSIRLWFMATPTEE